MKGFTEPNRIDVAPYAKGHSVWKWAGATAIVILAYVLIQNYLYLRNGLLKPDFSLIHQAYNFNLWTLPMILFGITMLVATLAFIWNAERRRLVWIGLLYGFAALDLLAFRYYVTSIEPQRLLVHHVRLETPKLSQAIRVLHISDIQAGAITEYEVDLFKQIKALNPDLILNTGDLLQVVPPATFESEFPQLLALIKAVSPRLGTYAVFGDTERELYHLSAKQLGPLQMLSSRSVRIDTGTGIIHLHGLSLYQSKNKNWAIRTVDPWLASAEPNDFTILFGHAPDYALQMVDQPIDLCLAGHTHGGQVRLPWYGALVIDSNVPKDWSRGFRRIGIPYLNVSAGAGSNRFEGLPPIRFNCPTEMTLIELLPLG
jgi:hypothetical protein